MTIRSIAFGSAIATLALVGAVNPAQAFSIINRSTLTDDQFRDLQTSKDFNEKFVAQSRIGNNRLNGTQEVDLLDASNNNSPVAQAQRKWQSGEAVDFTLEYDGSFLKYTVGGQLLSSQAFAGNNISDLFFRTRAANNSSAKLSNLKLTNGTQVNESLADLLSTGSGGSDIDYVQVTGLKGAFTLVGQSTFSWSGVVPTNSNLAYQIKAGTGRKIPEPTALGALAIAGFAVRSLKRKAAEA
jgi:hypothetical protein